MLAIPEGRVDMILEHEMFLWQEGQGVTRQ